MLFSRAVETALAALPRLDPAGPSGTGRRGFEIARLCGEPLPFLLKVLQGLARAGLLRSSRGRGGGFLLGRPAEEITLSDVVLAVEGAESLDVVLSLPHGPAREALAPAQEELIRVLRGTTVASLREGIDGGEHPGPWRPRRLPQGRELPVPPGGNR